MLCAVGATGGDDAGMRGTAIGWLRSRSTKQLGTYVAGTALVLSAPFGGWADAEPEPPPKGEVGAVLETGPLDITIDRVSASTRPGKGFTESEDGQYLLVFGTVESTTDETLTEGELTQAVRLVDLDGLERYASAPQIAEPADAVLADPVPHLADDATRMSTVSPGITYPVAWIWHRHERAVPETVRVQVRSFTFRQSTLQDTEGWLDPAPLTHLDLPVKQVDAYADPPADGSSS